MPARDPCLPCTGARGVHVVLDATHPGRLGSLVSACDAVGELDTGEPGGRWADYGSPMSMGCVTMPFATARPIAGCGMERNGRFSSTTT